MPSTEPYTKQILNKYHGIEMMQLKTQLSVFFFYNFFLLAVITMFYLKTDLPGSE